STGVCDDQRKAQQRGTDYSEVAMCAPIRSESPHWISLPRRIVTLCRELAERSSLGDARLTAHHLSNGWNLEMTVDAKIPGVSISDSFQSINNLDQCSHEFERNNDPRQERKRRKRRRRWRH